MEWYWPTDEEVLASLPGYRPNMKGHPRMIKEAAKLILDSERPVIYAGGGILKARAAEALRELVELTGIHVVTTLMARGAFPDDHELNLGMPGMHGNATAVTAMQRADLLVALGSRFDDRITGKVDAFAPQAKVIHVDIDPAEQGKVRKPDVPIVGDARLVIEEIIDEIKSLRAAGATQADTRAWKSKVSGWQEQFPMTYEQSEPGAALKPQYCIEQLRDLAPDKTIVASGRRSAPDVRLAVLAFQRSVHVGQLGWARHDGFLDPCGDRRQGCDARPHRLGDRRGRLFPDDGPGAGHRHARGSADQGGAAEQQLPRHGAPVAGDVLRRAVLLRCSSTRPRSRTS